MTKRKRPPKPHAYDPNLVERLRDYRSCPVDSSGRDCPDGKWALVLLTDLDRAILRLEPQPRMRPKSDSQKEEEERLIAWARRYKHKLEADSTPKGEATEKAAKKAKASRRSLLSWQHIKDRMQRRTKTGS